MRSKQESADNRRSVYLALVSSIESQIRDAYAKRFEEGSETQTTLAKKLGVEKSAVSRRLKGHTNMTLRTLADMVWGLGQCIEVDIFDPIEHPTNRKLVVPTTVRHDSGLTTSISGFQAQLTAPMGKWMRVETTSEKPRQMQLEDTLELHGQI
tara:strand:- start:1306 stop:1764 length:459 start_codon:yes stop_codon:yes gene_type:complete